MIEKNGNEGDKKDRKGQTCSVCKAGVYAILYPSDIKEGILHCTDCGHRVARYEVK